MTTPRATAPGSVAPGGVATEDDPIMPDLGHGFEFDGLDDHPIQPQPEPEPVRQQAAPSRPRGRPPGHRNPYEYVEQNHAPSRQGEIGSQLNVDNIVTGKRGRKPNPRYANIAITLARCFATALTSATYGSKDNPSLPPKPTTHKQALRHQFASQ